MRQLNAKQKKLLDEWYDNHRSETEIGKVFFDLGNCVFFPAELYDRLQELGDHETIYQNINRYIAEK